MQRWTRRIFFFGAALLAGCAGTIGKSESGNGTGNGGTGPGPSSGDAGGPGPVPGTGGSGLPGVGGMVVISPPPVTCTPGVPVTSQLPRLSHVQYDNTAR